MNGDQYMSAVHAYPCLVCTEIGLESPPVEAHHVGYGYERDNFLVVPLCTEHHRGATGIGGLSRRGFERRYKMTELQMIAKTMQLVLKGL